MQQVISHTYPATYRSTLIRSCVILSHPSFLRVGRPFMDVVSWLCIRQLPCDGCLFHADDVRLLLTRMMIDMLTNIMTKLYGGFLTWPKAVVWV